MLYMYALFMYVIGLVLWTSEWGSMKYVFFLNMAKQVNEVADKTEEL